MLCVRLSNSYLKKKQVKRKNNTKRREGIMVSEQTVVKKALLVGKCGKCKREFTAEATLPLIELWDEQGNSYKSFALPHLVELCPFCFGLLNLAKRVETNKRKE